MQVTMMMLVLLYLRLIDDNLTFYYNMKHVKGKIRWEKAKINQAIRSITNKMKYNFNVNWDAVNDAVCEMVDTSENYTEYLKNIRRDEYVKIVRFDQVEELVTFELIMVLTLDCVELTEKLQINLANQFKEIRENLDKIGSIMDCNMLDEKAVASNIYLLDAWRTFTEKMIENSITILNRKDLCKC